MAAAVVSDTEQRQRQSSAAAVRVTEYNSEISIMKVAGWDTWPFRIRMGGNLRQSRMICDFSSGWAGGIPNSEFRIPNFPVRVGGPAS